MPLLQRCSSSASLILWEKQGTNNNYKQQGGKKSSKSSRPPLSSSLLLAADDYHNNHNNNSNNHTNDPTMGLFTTEYGYQRRQRSYSNTGTTTSRRRSKSHQRYYYEGSNNFSIPIFSTESEGIEAILPPSTTTSTSMRRRRSSETESNANAKSRSQSQSGGKKEQQQLLQQQQQQHSQPSSKWYCLTPFSSGTFSKKNARQSVPPVLTATSSSDDGKQERFDLSFDQNLHPEWDYAFDADLWNQKEDPQNVLESSRVDTTFASISSASSGSSPRPEPVVLSLHDDPHNSTANYLDTKKKPKWKKRIFFWRQPDKIKHHTNSGIDHHHSSSHNNNKANNNSFASQDENATSWRDNPFRNDNRRDHHNYKEHDRYDEQPILDSILSQTGMNNEQAVECEYRGDIGVRDWFAISSSEDKSNDFHNHGDDGIHPSCSFSVMGLDLDETNNHINTTIKMMMIMNNNNNNNNNNDDDDDDDDGLKDSSLGEEEESLIDADELTRTTSSVVKELGQYAREMQSKASAITPSPSCQRKSSFPKPATPSRLLCALPGLGSKLLNISNRSNKDNKDNDCNDANFADPEENWPDYESDNNSYLAVSYTEECAQLVMQQSDELTRDLLRMEEEQRLAAAATACGGDHDEDSDDHAGDDDIGRVHHHLYDSSSPDTSPQGYVGHEDTGYMEEDGVDDSSTFRAADAEDVIRNDLDYLMRRRSSRSSHSLNNPSGSTNNLGASFPHPAAQLRDDFVLQLSAQRQLKHPSPFTSTEEDDEESPPVMAHTSLRQDIDKVARTVMGARTLVGARNSLRSFQGTPEVTTGPQVRHFSMQDREVKERQETSSRARNDPPSNSSSSVHTPKTMRSNLLERTRDKDDQMKQPWVLQRRDDPPGWANGVARPDPAPTRTFRHGQCLTTTNMSSYGPACAGTGVPMWKLSEPKETNWGGTTLPTFPTQKTLSTWSTSSDDTYPLEERIALATSNFWGIYQPIHNAAKGVSQSLCENVYARKEQPATVPFDEWEEDDIDYRERRRSWATAGASKSTSSSSNVASCYESSYRYRPDEQSCSTDPISWPPDESTEHDSYFSHMENTPDPEIVLPEQRDTRRQLL